MKLNIFDMNAIVEMFNQGTEKLDLSKPLPLESHTFAHEVKMAIAPTDSDSVLLRFTETLTGSDLPVAVSEMTAFQATNLGLSIFTLLDEDALDEVISILFTIAQQKAEMTKQNTKPAKSAQLLH